MNRANEIDTSQWAQNAVHNREILKAEDDAAAAKFATIRPRDFIDDLIQKAHDDEEFDRWQAEECCERAITNNVVYIDGIDPKPFDAEKEMASFEEFMNDESTREFHAFIARIEAREYHSFGIGDGIYRRKLNYQYRDDADYIEGYIIGLRIPALQERE